MLATVFVASSWLLQHEDRAPLASGTATHGASTDAAPLAVTTEHEKGGLAELPDDLAHARSVGPPPYVVYLVDSPDHQRAFIEAGLTDGQAALIAGTPQELATAAAHIHLLTMNAEAESRTVQVVDLRSAPVAPAISRRPADHDPNW
jgi:hypothetical protein